MSHVLFIDSLVRELGCRLKVHIQSNKTELDNRLAGNHLLLGQVDDTNGLLVSMYLLGC